MSRANRQGNTDDMAPLKKRFTTALVGLSATAAIAALLGHRPERTQHG